jgi:hypothetical protein
MTSTNAADLASAASINVLIVIDTEKVKSTVSNPSKDPTKPTQIDHSTEYMICTGSRGIISGQGGPVLNFKANPGDQVSFCGQSIYANADDAVIVYGIQHFTGDKVFNKFDVNTVSRSGAAFPDTGTSNGLPAVNGPAVFNTLDSKVKGKGTEGFQVQFALYTLDTNGETQGLLGYYQWDPTITVL